MGLAPPTPASEAAGNYITGALWNSQIYNGLTFLLNPPIFVATQSATQSISNQTWTPLTLDTTQADTYGGHSNSVNNSRYTCQQAGYYDVCGVGVATNNGTGVRAVRLSVNGSTNVVTGSACMLPSAGASNYTGMCTPVRTILLNAGDYVEVALYQSSGGALSTGVASDLASALWLAFRHV